MAALCAGCWSAPDVSHEAAVAIAEQMGRVGNAPANIGELPRARWTIEVDGEASREVLTLRGHAGVVDRFSLRDALDDSVDPIALGVIAAPNVGVPVRDVALALGSSVHRHVEQRRVFEQQAPAATWEAGEGDCTELADLLASSLRGLGIQARVVGGAAAAGGDLRFHAWVEYRDGGDWIGIDPTWDEFPLHSGYVPLDVGATSADLERLEATITRTSVTFVGER